VAIGIKANKLSILYIVNKRHDITEPGFQAGPYFPNFPYFFTAALTFLIKASKS
jgi:hypothetical protein